MPAAKPEKKSKGAKKISRFYKIVGGKIECSGKPCDRCGSATFMADHKDRWYCGKCQLTVWKKKE
jgi:small subunit ribosomal protein S27Ae